MKFTFIKSVPLYWQDEETVIFVQIGAITCAMIGTNINGHFKRDFPETIMIHAVEKKSR